MHDRDLIATCDILKDSVHPSINSIVLPFLLSAHMKCLEIGCEKMVLASSTSECKVKFCLIRLLSSFLTI